MIRGTELRVLLSFFPKETTGGDAVKTPQWIKRLGGPVGELCAAATYTFFAFQAGHDPITALKSVKKLKPFYSETQIAVGVSRAKEFLFQPSEQDTSELRKELSSWQAAAIGSMSLTDTYRFCNTGPDICKYK